MTEEDTYRKTRYEQFGYVNDGPNLWRIVHLADGIGCGRIWPRVGPFYRTKAELLADLDRYVKEYGYR